MPEVAQLPGRRGRPRSTASEQAVLGAALDLLAEGQTPAAITIAEIARRAGAGKDTIYRRWQCKEDLLLDALASQVGELELPDSASLREVLVVSLAELIERLQTDSGRRISRALQNAGDDFPKLRARYRETIIRRRHDFIAKHVRAAVARGELRPGLDLELVVQMPFHHVLFAAINDEPVLGDPRAAAGRLIDALLTGIVVSQPDDAGAAHSSEAGCRAGRKPARDPG